MAYIDLQVNGAFGIDFNDDALTLEQFRFACNQLQKTGVVGFLPTIITDSIPSMIARIRKIATWVEHEQDLRGVIRGIHVEGPFLSSKTGFYGTHPPLQIKEACVELAMQLLEAGQGFVRLMTLAPEQDLDCSVTSRMCAENVLVFAGHSDASVSQLKKSIQHGLSGFTHLGNGCVHQVDRQDNIMQRVLAFKDQLYVTLIADGVHVPAWLIQSWLNIIGPNRCMVISDSMSAAGMPAGDYSIGGQLIRVDAYRRTRHSEHGYLAGSASTMADMDRWITESIDADSTVREKILHSNANELLR